MKQGRGFGPFLIAAALLFPVCLNVLQELYGPQRDSGPPAAKDYGFGDPPASLLNLPSEARRGKYVPARVIRFFAPSPFRTAFLVYCPEGAQIEPGCAVVGPGPSIAGLVTRVLPGGRLLIVRHVEDPAFHIEARTPGAESFILYGRGFGQGLQAAGEARGLTRGEVLRATGRGNIFPPGVVIGFVSRSSKSPFVSAAFDLNAASWVLVWRNPDAEALRHSLGFSIGGL